MEELLQNVVSGIIIGSVYAMVALGFVLVYKASGIFNLCIGELLLAGAFFFWSCLDWWHLPVWLCFLLTFLFCSCVGWVLNRLMIRPMIGQPILAIIMMTIALSVFLQGFLLLIWKSPTERYSTFLPKTTIHLGEVLISPKHLLVFGVAVMAVVVLTIYFRRTKSGLAMRAVAEDHQVAQGTGISVKSVFSLVWVIAAVLSGIAGVLLATTSGVNFNLAHLGMRALPAVLLGGMDSIHGAIIAGIIIGLCETLAIGYLDPIIGYGSGNAIPFLIMIGILLVRPYGLFGMRTIERI